MNTRPVLDSGKGPFALSASFNADKSCFSVALETGFRGMRPQPASTGIPLTRTVYSSKSGDQKVARGM